MKPVQIIAEAGVNHNGDISRALDLIDVAAEAGADMVKFQTFQSKKLATASARKAIYQLQNTRQDESQLEMLKRFELSRDQHLQLIEHCKRKNLEFLSTPFDQESIQMLVDLGLKKLKIPSGEVTNTPYLRHIAIHGMPVFLSTGMCTLADVETAIRTLTSGGLSREKLVVLHCNTEYPTPMKDVNLNAMLTIRDSLKVAIGYSDHTLGSEVSIAAVALGATVIEKHFTLDRTLPGPDHAASSEPEELKAMIAAIRNIETAMGDGIKGPSPSERPNMQVARKSIVACKVIRAGETFTEENLTTKRPGTEMCPTQWDSVIGKTAVRDFAEDEPIQWQ